MKPQYIALFLACQAACASPVVVIDAGISRVVLTGARYETNPDPVIAREDRNAWSPLLGVSAELSERISLRLGYQHIGNLQTEAVYSVPPGPGPVKPQVVVPAHYESDIHITGIGAQFRMRLGALVSVFISPEANWVLERGRVRYLSSALTDRNRDQITLGGSAGVRYEMGRRWASECTYRYIDASPSWNRSAHVLAIALSFR